jgi:Fic family protein
MKSSNKRTLEQIDAIINTLKRFKIGASIEEIRTAFGRDIELRTLQRRLAELKKLGFVTTSGDKRSTRYHLAQPQIVRSEANLDEPAKDLLPLTDEGRKILEIISRPLLQRKPIGYNIEFLEMYRPNIDNYLTQYEMEKLAQIGKTARLDQPAGTYAREILSRLLIDLSYNSSRLEGNTYSLLDTQRLISIGEAADDKTAMEAQMILNHKEAIQFIVQGGEEIRFNRYTILNLHGLLSSNLLPDPAASGRLRSFGVGISHSVYIPLGIPQQIERMFELILEKAEQIENPFEQAFFIMVHIPYLQPFDDVNKRVSRLAANIPFNRHNLSPLSFIDVPNDLYFRGLLGVYELNRVELLRDLFIWGYERSAQRYAALRQSLGEPDQFRLKYREEIRILISEIVTNALPPKRASAKIRAEANSLSEADQQKFIEVVDSELLSLHEGNFARYRIKPSEFKRWKEVWEQT